MEQGSGVIAYEGSLVSFYVIPVVVVLVVGEVWRHQVVVVDGREERRQMGNWRSDKRIGFHFDAPHPHCLGMASCVSVRLDPVDDIQTGLKRK